MAHSADRWGRGIDPMENSALRKMVEQSTRLQRISALGSLDIASKLSQVTSTQRVLDSYFNSRALATSALGLNAGTLAAYNDTLAANRAVSLKLDFLRLQVQPAYLDALAALSEQATASIRTTAAANLVPALIAPTRLSARAYRIAAESSPSPSSRTDTARIAYATQEAFGTAELSLELQDLDGDEEPREAPDPVESIPEQMRDDLRTELSLLDPRLVTRLEGAWDRAARPGPDAASQAAHSAQELLDGTLHAAAPTEAVLGWHGETGRPPDGLHNGRPTRLLRARYVVRSRPGDDAVVDLHIRSLRSMCSLLQKFKHGPDEPSAADLRFIMVELEGVLGFLLANQNQAR